MKKSLKEQRISHAYIFEGPVGIGKKTLAAVFCRAIFCTSADDVPCGRCDACRRFEAGVHPDYKAITPQKNVIGIEQIRILIDDIYKKPYMSNRKLYLISDAQTMTLQAQNALLKTLEEPPTYSTIILVTTSVDAMLSTVVSRCQVYKLKPLSISTMKDILVDRFNVQPSVAQIAASFSDGIIGKALAMAKDNASQVLRQSAVENLRNLIEHKWDVLFSVESFFMEHKDEADFILNCWIDWVRNNILCQITGEMPYEFLQGSKEQINAGGFTFLQWNSIMEYIDAARKALISNANYQLAIDVLLLEILEVMDNAHSGGNKV